MYDNRLRVEYKRQATKIPEIQIFLSNNVKRPIMIALYKNKAYLVEVHIIGDHFKNYCKCYVSLILKDTYAAMESFREDNTVSTMNIQNLIYFLNSYNLELTPEQELEAKAEYDNFCKRLNNER